MNNICRNGIQALVVYKDSYLLHSPFPSFALDGSAAFTIEIRFAYSKSSSGILYAQDGGLTIGFNNDIPYFDHPVLGRLEGTNDRKLERNCLLMLSVTYDLEKVSMQINGIPVAELKKQSGAAYANDGNFAIGKEFDGYMEGVRVLKKVSDSQALLSDYGIGFQENADVVFQTDFTTKQFKDIGPDKISMWRNGTEAHCANVVTTTKLDRKAAYKRTNKLSFREGFSVSARVFPDFSCKTKQTIYSVGDKDAKITVSMEPDAENNYVLSACVGSTCIKSSKVIDGLLWHDVVLAVDIKNKKAALYLDGAAVADGKADISAIVDSTAVIGSEFFEDKPHFREGLLGYLDYVAEFSKMVSQEEVERFIEHEPYFYDDGIESLLLFGWGEPRNAMLGYNIAEFGSGYFTMVEDTCPLDTPRGTGWIVPQEPDEAYWASLSDNERWALATYIETANATINDMIGIPMKDPGIEPATEIVHRKYLGPDTEELLAWAKGAKDTEFDGILEESTINNKVKNIFNKTKPEVWKTIQQPLTMGEVGASTVVAPVAAGSAATTGVSSEAIFQTAVAVSVVALVATEVARIVKENEKDRPDNPKAKVKVVSCSWNNQGKAESGTIYFHNDAKGVEPSSMEWPNNGTDVKMEAVFIPAVLKELILRVKVTNTGDAQYVGNIKATGGGKTWESAPITLAVGETKVVTLNQSDLIATMGKELSVKSGFFSLTYKDPEDATYIFMNNVTYTYYTLENKPIEPWQLDEGKEYDPKNACYIRTLVLNSLLTHHNSVTVPALAPAEQAMATLVMNWMNTGGLFTYDTDSGACFYTTNFNQFKIDKFVRDAVDVGAAHWLNCADCANIMHAICAMNGIDLPMCMLFGVNRQGFGCNQIKVISYKDAPWRVPFAGEFSYHMVNRTANGVYDGIGIYDACLKVDGGEYPGVDAATNPAKVPLQPNAMQAQATLYANVDVPTTAAYHDVVYRERLVRNTQWAAFVDFPGSVQAFRIGDYSAGLSGMQVTEGKLKGDGRIRDMKPLSWEFHEYEWHFSFDDSAMEMLEYGWAHSDDDMQKIIRQFANPERTEVKDETAGIDGFRIGESCYVIRKNDKIYRIMGEKAMTVAKEIL